MRGGDIGWLGFEASRSALEKGFLLVRSFEDDWHVWLSLVSVGDYLHFYYLFFIIIKSFIVIFMMLVD